MADTVLVTGGSGYFGSLLVQKVLDRGARCRVFDLVDIDERPETVGFVQGDIREYERVREACDGIDVIYHCVAQVPLARDKELFHSVNVLGTENLLAAALDAGVRKVVLLSSSAVYGIPDRNPVDDTTPLDPQEEYGRAKVEAERRARRFHHEQGMDITIIRPRTILGHGRLGIFQLLFDWVADGKSVYVLGRGDNVYQFVHADDLAEACIKAAARPGLATYNIGAERYCTMRESLEGLVAHAGTGSTVRSLPMTPAVWLMELLSKVGLAPFAPYHWLLYGRELYFDVSRAKAELDWQPRWGNVEMLCQSYDWYLAHRAEITTRREGSAHRSPVRQGLLVLLRWLS